jgi:sugar/nucleoside kinase (ribokinase family)
MSLLAIGTLGYDDVETIHAKRTGLLGGSAVHFAVAAAPYGPVRLVSVVGGDWRAEDSRLLEGRGVDLAGLEVAEGKTFRWGGRYEPNWNKRHTVFTELNVLETFQPKLPPAYRDSRFVFLANAHPAVQMAALAQVREPRFVVADTMNLWIDIARPELDTLLRRVDGVILNDEEAAMLTSVRRARCWRSGRAT